MLLLLLFLAGPWLALTQFQQPDIPIDTDKRPQFRYMAPITEPVLALTFEIGWDSPPSEAILDILKENQVSATFFLPGSIAAEHTRFLQRLTGEGHELACLGCHDLNLAECSSAKIASEIRSARDIFREKTGCTPVLFRTPDAEYSNAILEEAAQQGMAVVLWSLDSLDWRSADVQSIVSRVLSRAHPGAIIRFQGGEADSLTGDALPVIIDGLRSLGYQFLPAGKLLKLTEQAPAPQAQP